MLQTQINEAILKAISGDIWPKEIRISPELHKKLTRETGPLEFYMGRIALVRDNALRGQIKILGGHEEISIDA